MKKIILFSIVAVMAVTFAGFAQTITVFSAPKDCGGCGGGDRVCCASTSQNFG
ncbi:hypothetical protein [Flavobacterium sp. UBA7680]|uniref:hypothetical protein n=1 Tax=Flavobacterium sp. UBA7680 TaxID=1946559 RepID=UPI0025C61F77|nr:hypothetical protein [Flavobacterium sp. UBA7680]